MTQIAVVTDTDASLPSELAEEYEIYQVPITVHFGEEVLRSGEDITDREMFARIEREGVLPTTAAPSPGDFARTYQQARDDGAEEVVCLTVSSEVSATYQAALSARDLIPEVQVTVVDSWSVSMGQGFMALEAAEMARRGSSVEEITARARDIRDHTRLYAALDTLKYMAMSGRVGHITAGMANFLDIKPILTIQDGKLDLLEKVRTRKKAWKKILDLSRDDLNDGGEIKRIFILHVDAPVEAGAFEVLLREVLGYNGVIPHAELSPGLSVHTGSGVVGTAFLMAGEA